MMILASRKPAREAKEITVLSYQQLVSAVLRAVGLLERYEHVQWDCSRDMNLCGT